MPNFIKKSYSPSEYNYHPTFSSGKGPLSYDIQLTDYSHIASLTPSWSAGLNANTLCSTHHLTRAICSLLRLDRHAGKPILGQVLLPPNTLCASCPVFLFHKPHSDWAETNEMNRSSCSSCLISTTFLTQSDHIKCPAWHSLEGTDWASLPYLK